MTPWDTEIRRAPWDLQDGEPPESYRYFEHFLIKDVRSIKKFALSLGLAPHALYLYAGKWRWKARKAALVHHLSRVHSEAREDAVRAQGALHGAAFALALDWAVESILHSRAAGDLLSPKEALSYLRTAFEAQRLIGGEPQARLSIELARADLDQLDKMAEILDAIQAKE